MKNSFYRNSALKKVALYFFGMSGGHNNLYMRYMDEVMTGEN